MYRMAFNVNVVINYEGETWHKENERSKKRGKNLKNR